MSIAESRFSQPALELSPKFLKVALVLKASRHLTAALAIGIMHHRLVIANCIGVQRTDREVVVRRRPRPHRQRRDRRRVPAQLDDLLTDAQVACRDPAAIRRQPRMVRGGVDRLVGVPSRGRLAAVGLGGDLLGFVRRYIRCIRLGRRAILVQRHLEQIVVVVGAVAPGGSTSSLSAARSQAASNCQLSHACHSSLMYADAMYM